MAHPATGPCNSNTKIKEQVSIAFRINFKVTYDIIYHICIPFKHVMSELAAKQTFFFESDYPVIFKVLLNCRLPVGLF